MIDREKVIKGLEVCIPLDEGENCPKECPYYRDVCLGCNQVMRDALSLLKEQPEIVRCISCTFYRSDGECALHNDKWRPEGFCSWAIRKEGR